MSLVRLQYVKEDEVVKMLWDFKIQTDEHAKRNKSNLLIVNMKERSLKLAEIAIPMDENIAGEQIEKIENYGDLAIELKEIWSMNYVEVIRLKGH